MNPKIFHSCRWILFALLILVCASITGGSSSALAGGEEWRPVDAADIALKTPIVEPNADAEAIFWDIRIDDVQRHRAHGRDDVFVPSARG